MLKCAILDDYQDAALGFADWSRISDAVEVTRFDRHLGHRSHVVEQLADYDIIVAMRERTAFDAQTLGQLSRLKLLVTTGPVNAAIDLEAARENGVLVCGTSGDRSSTAELTWALILNLARGICAEHASIRAGGWQTHVGMAMQGRRLGLLGLGHIGKKVAQYGQVFGMEVSAWSPNLTRERCDDAGIAMAESMDALFASSDMVSLHLALGETTRGIVTDRQLRLMKPHAFLINTARAELVEEEPLMRVLQEGRIAGAGLDVFHEEPLSPGSPWRNLPGVLATPHIGYVADRVYRIYYEGVVEAIVQWLRGTPVRIIVEPR